MIQAACGETQAAQFSRWGLDRRSITGQTTGDETHAAFGRRSIPAKQPVMKRARRSAGDPSRLTAALRAAHRCVSVGIHPVFLPRAPCQTGPTGRTGPRRPRRSRGFHHRLFTASLRAAHRCVSVGIHRVFLPHAPCQPGASPASALTRVPPPAVHRVAARRSSLRFGRDTSGIPRPRALSGGRFPHLGAHAGFTTGC